MTVNYVKDGKAESFETRPGFELKLEAAETTAEAVWLGEAKDGYFDEAVWVYGATHFEVS